MNIIDFNDLMLTGYGPDGAIQHAAPALANVDDDGQLTFGEAALRRHRSQPQTSQSHYLARLTDAVFTPSIGQAQTQADLLYYQLAGLQQQQTTDEVAAVITSQLSNTQLGLLLGICEALPLKVRCFIDRALLAHPQQMSNDSYHVLDLGLHQSVLSRVAMEQQTLRVIEHKALPNLGLFTIVDGWLNQIADVCIQNSRFDPLHNAAGEQSLFDQIYAWLQQEQGGNLNVSVMHNGASRNIEVTTQELSATLQKRIDQELFSAVGALQLTATSNHLPGIQNLIKSIMNNTQIVDLNHYLINAISIHENASEAQVERISELNMQRTEASLSAPAIANNEDASGAAKVPATHLLLGSTAKPLTHADFNAFLDADGLLRPQTTALINGAAPISARLAAGDHVQFGDATWLAISAS